MNAPTVSIGLVVHNGAAHLEAAIRSLLDQTLRDFELIVLDNASTDETPVIVERLAAHEPRIRSVRHDVNIGALGNFITAVESARGMYFCWAGHDDLREPQFLQCLVNLLQEHPSAGLAACAARDISVDGSPGAIRHETRELHALADPVPAKRVATLLCRRSCAAMYGLYRTTIIRELLEELRRNARPDRGAVFGGDVVFLAALLARHTIVTTDDPLLSLRPGGMSHRLDCYRDLFHCLRELRAFARRLREVTASVGETTAERRLVRRARHRAIWDVLGSPGVRRILRHGLARSVPMLDSLAARWQLRRCEAFRTLRLRTQSLPRGARVVVFGAGKHMHRTWRTMRLAIEPHGTIVGVWDDHAVKTGSWPWPVVRAEDLAGLDPQLILISSDAHEAALYRRAVTTVPTNVPVWRLYDTGAAAPTSPSTLPAPRAV